jgi:hypothetical protein
MRQSVIIGRAREASGLEEWMVSARVGSRNGDICERTCWQYNSTRVENGTLVKGRNS